MLNLEKGQKLDLTKGTNLVHLTLGLAWEEKNPNANGTDGYDLDASAILLDVNKKVVNGDMQNIIYFGNLKHSTGAITHSGDNLTGEGKGDDERIMIDLSKVPADCNEIITVVNIYKADERKQNFGQVKDAYIRMFNTDNEAEVLGKYDLSEDYSAHTGVIMGSVYRHGTEWKFQAVGEGRTGDLNAIIASY